MKASYDNNAALVNVISIYPFIGLLRVNQLLFMASRPCSARHIGDKIVCSECFNVSFSFQWTIKEESVKAVLGYQGLKYV